MKRFFWFILTVLGIVFLVSFFSTSMLIWKQGDAERDWSDANIAVIEVTGVITESMPIMEQIRKIQKNKQFKAVVLRIDSPGGAVGASQEIYLELKKLRNQIPVVASMGNLAASGGLYISLGVSHVVTLPGTITGSMGVLTTITNFSRLLEKIYVDPITIKSGSLKDAGNPTRPMDAKAKEFLQQTINLTFDQFRADVKNERGLSDEVMKKISDGRIVLGTEAVEMGLAHQTGSFLDAVDWAMQEAKIEGDPKLAFVSREPKGLIEKILEGPMSQVLQQITSRATGLFYIWQPEYSGG